MGKITAAGLCALLLLTPPAAAQRLFEIREEVDFDRPEAWAMKYFASVAQPAGLGTPDETQPGAVELAFEAGWVPSLSERQRTVGFAGTKTEDLNRTSVFGRLRARVGLPAGLALEAGVVPPFDLDGVEAGFFYLALDRPLRDAPRWRLGGRLFGQRGTVEGDLTCSARDVAAGADLTRNPFLCEEPSRDEMTIRAVGAELSAAFPLPGKRFEPHLALAVTRLDLEFLVRARYSGIIDRTLLLTEGDTVALTAGLTWAVGERNRLSVDLFYSPLEISRPPSTRAESDDLFNVRALYGYRLR